MGRNARAIRDQYIRDVADRLVDQGVLPLGEEAGITIQVIEAVEEAQAFVFRSEAEEEEVLPGVDPFAFLVYLGEEEALFPRDPLDFVREYIDRQESFSLEEFIREDADSDAHEANEFANRGNSRFHLGRVEEALEDYDRAVELAPDRPHPYEARGRALLEIGNLEKALEDIEKALSLSSEGSPSPGGCRLLLAEILLRLGDCEGAQERLEATARELHAFVQSPLDEYDHFLLPSGVVASDGIFVHWYHRLNEMLLPVARAGLDTGPIETLLHEARSDMEAKGVDLEE